MLECMRFRLLQKGILSAQRPLVWLLALCILGCLLSCGTSSSPSANGSSDTTKATPGGAFPVTITDGCGVRTTYTRAPQRIVTTDDWDAEMLVALGLGDKIVGTGFPMDSKQLSDGSAAAQIRRIPKLSDQFPSFEQLAGATPDFLVTSNGTSLNGKRLPNRDDLTHAGIKTYALSNNCHTDAERRDLNGLFADLHNFSLIFGLGKQGDQLVANLTHQLDTIHARLAKRQGAPLKVFVWSGEDPPSPPGGAGIANAVITLAGGQNIFAAQSKNYVDTSWEEVVKAAPDVIWIFTHSGPDSAGVQDGDGIIAKLLAVPAARNIPAVKNHRFVAVSYADGGQEGMRNVQAVQELFQSMYPELGR